MFALVVLLSDGYVRVKSPEKKEDHEEPEEVNCHPAARFFRILTQLPIELQMVATHRVAKSNRSIVRSRDSELGFRHALRVFAEEEEEEERRNKKKERKSASRCIVS